MISSAPGGARPAASAQPAQNKHAKPAGKKSKKQTNWEEYGKHLFENLYSKTRMIFEVRSFDRNYSATKKKRQGEDEIRIACVSSPIKVRFEKESKTAGGFDLRTVRYRDDCHLVQADHKDIPEMWEAERLRELKAALKEFPHVVCFSEFAFPPIWREQRPGWNIEAIRGTVNSHSEYEAAVLELLKAHEGRIADEIKAEPGKDCPVPFVHLGSYHCLMTLYNVGVTLPWGSSTDPQDCLVSTEPRSGKPRPETSMQSIAAPIFQRKRYPARKIGEHTRIPATRNFDIYKLPFGQVAILICSDVIDLNQFLSVVRYNHSGSAQPPIDFILVPSFNQSDRLPEMCRELSFLANATVVLVNANPEDATGRRKKRKFPITDVYCRGRSCVELKEKMERDGTDARSDLEPVIDIEEINVVHGDTRRAKVFLFRLSARGIEGPRHEMSGALAKGDDPGDEHKGNA